MRDLLLARAGVETDLIILTTSGDKIQDRRLADCGGKSLFTKEIDLALLNGEVDLAVHSVKDLEGFLPPGVHLAVTLKREDPRDVLVSPHFKSFEEIPSGARFGTSSPRREAQALALRPDLEIVLLRGNVDTRLEKIRRGDCDFTLLAVAGLKRLGLYDEYRFPILDPKFFLPCIGQGAIGITCREGDQAIYDLLQTMNHAQTFQEISIERAFLKGLKGGCKTPVAGLCVKTGEEHFSFQIFIARQGGSDSVRRTATGSYGSLKKEACSLGQEMALWLEGEGHDSAHKTA